jgi:hypothetical protein
MEDFPEFQIANLNYAGGHVTLATIFKYLVAQATILVDNIEP